MVATFLDGLPNTLLVQLSWHSAVTGKLCGVYAVYREAMMTFEVTSRVKIARCGLSAEEALGQFVESPEFKDAILTPLVAQVRQHFARSSSL